VQLKNNNHHLFFKKTNSSLVVREPSKMIKQILAIFLIIEICGQTLGYENCGVAEIDIEITGLVANGQSFKKGSWPWLAGLFHHAKYICAGTLSNFFSSLFSNYFFKF
jgi:hypothetical protein